MRYILLHFSQIEGVCRLGVNILLKISRFKDYAYLSDEAFN